VNVGVYRGTNGKEVGNASNNSEIPTVTPFGLDTSINSAGYMVQGTTPLYFYPYVRMSYQTTGSNKKIDVNVLSQFYSKIIGNDCAEVAWFNPDPESIKMSSTQWSLHARAIDTITKSWGGRNSVLPGGAIFQLGTGSSPTKVALITWQTIIGDPERRELSEDIPANEYTLAKATSDHNAYVKESTATIDAIRMVQWVNGDVNASNAWTNNGQSVKITDGNQSLSALGSGATTSTESKYRLGRDAKGDLANEGDLDIIKSIDSQDVFFKVFADTSRSYIYGKKHRRYKCCNSPKWKPT